VAGSFTVGALAVASPEANAVGAVRLTLLPKRLEIELLRAGSYADGFVPGALTRFVRFSVPYTAVRGFVRRGEGLGLTLDPFAAVPFNRFHLTCFTDLPLEALASAHKRRQASRLLAWLLPLPLAALSVLAVPPSWASGFLGRGAVGAVVMIALGALAKQIGATLTFGGPLATRLQRSFERRLAERVGLVPAASHETDPFELPELPEVVALARAAAPAAETRARARAVRVPWARLGYAFAAACVVIGLVAGFRTLRGVVPERAPEAQAGFVNTTVADDETLLASKWPPCTCERADSPLWRGGVPILSVLPISKRQDPGRALGDISPLSDEEGISRYDFDLAVVNNAAVALNDLRVLLTFARRDKKGRRRGVTDRGLFWEGELGPGRSVKWGVKAPGSELRVDVPEKRLLGTVASAPADSFRKLLSARQPLVRLHAATMLAYLGDPGAADAARGLGALPPTDELTRARILRATAPLRVCEIASDAGTLTACVHNASDSVARGLSLVEVTPGGDGRRRPIDEPVLPRSGLRVSFEGFGAVPEEVIASEAE
jgi:hypothetical protein